MSEILKLQDKNMDGFIDVCETTIPRNEKRCLECKPKPSAIVPDWTKRDVYSPFLNERQCKFQITYTTPYTTTGGEVADSAEQADEIMNDRFKEFAEEAIDELLNYYNKENTPDVVSELMEDIEFTQFDLAAVPSSHLKLLYSFPFTTINGLEDAEEEEEEEDIAPGEDKVVTYIPNVLQRNLIRVRKGLHLYNSNLKVYRALEGKNLLFEKGGVFNLEQYGDFALFGESTMSRIFPQLNDFFRQHGFTLGRRSPFFPSRDAIYKFECTFDPEYKIKKIRVWAESCKEKPYQLGRKKLKVLNNKHSFRDPTAMSYLAHIDAMERDLTARRPKPWVEFLLKYTYPKIYDTQTKPPEEIGPMQEAMSCVGEALQNDLKQLGQDMLDEVFGIGDAVAAQFHKMICEPEYTEILLAEYVMGKNDSPEEKERKKKNNEKRRKNVRSKMEAQAYDELEENNVIMTGICHRLMAICGGPGSQNRFDLLWLHTLDPLRLCGLFDLMTDLLKCLMGGVTFEQMLATIIRSALKAMSIENFGSLFVGLPPDKQAELDALVQRKLASGDISGPGRALDNTSTAIESGAGPSEPPFIGKVKFKKPWTDAALVAEQKAEHMRDGPLEGESAASVPSGGDPNSQLSKATAAAQLSDAGAGLSPNVIMEAYLIALLEVYTDDLMSLLDELNKFPGAEIIAKVIATFDCARPPLFDPSIMDFLKDLELPFCRNVQAIHLPRMENPFAWLPKIWDIMRILWWLAKQMLYDLIWRLICKLFVWICEKISDAICKLLELAGSLAAAALSGGRTTFADAIRDTLCGPGADQEKVEDTIEDLFKQIGQGGAEAAGDRQSLMNFVEDLSATTTQQELMSAVLGEPSSTFLDVVGSLTEFEHPQFQTMFPNGEQTAQFFTNIGNLMPLEARAAARDALNSLPEDIELPANPTLCATQADLDNFCAVRAQILEGRASSEQIQELCSAARGSFEDDLESLADLMQQGIPAYFDDNMPPLMSSDPTCDDGLIPYEPEEIAAAASTAMGGALDVLRIAYSQDMLGNGPGKNNWGFINMVLSDTMGNPYTTHIRKSANSGGWFSKRKYVDFYVDGGDMDDANEGASYAKTKRQRGAFPAKVAGRLQDQMNSQFKSADFSMTNNFQDDKSFTKSFKDLNIGGLFDDVDLTELPNFGYNVTVTPKYDEKRIKFTRHARKKDPDMTLKFKDRAQGRENDEGYMYGFDIDLFVSDIVKNADGKYYNRPDDNARVVITHKLNTNYKGPGDDEFRKEAKEDKGKSKQNKKVLKWSAYEFFSTDDGLDMNSDVFETGDYNEFILALQSPVSNTPPSLLLFSEIIKNSHGSAPPISSLKSMHKSFTDSLTKLFGEEIAGNDVAFNYGAVFDNITEEDLRYGVVENGSFTDMEDYADRLDNPRAEAPFGMSYMQYCEEYPGKCSSSRPNQVFYLDPASYGGNNLNPPVYLKPVDKNGWLGIVDAMFPELSPCKPSKTELVDFGEIKDLIDEVYNKIPEDKRLKSDPDCVTEKPYNRILERNSKAGIEGLIHAACRIFASQHFLKSLATFTRFYPDIRNNFSSIYAAYIVEVMEEELKDAQPSALAEAFNPFKDDEFWYAFLEQSVQCYARKVADGDVEPSPSVVAVLQQLEEFEKNYRYPYRPRLKQAKKAKETGPFKRLKGYRFERNLEAIKESEDLAKLILKEYVIEEMDYMASVFMKNLQDINMVDPSTMVRNLNYYVLQFLSVNHSLDLQKQIEEQVTGLPTEGNNLYTNGGELANEETNEPYVGYYHVMPDEETGDPIYMQGEEHAGDDSQALLYPFANKLIVPIGNIESIKNDSKGSASAPFVLGTYIKVGGTKMDPSDAVDTITGGDLGLNISDVYPGTMSIVRDPETEEPIGLTGELGVRYGLRLSVTVGGTNYTVIETEIDALDTPVGQFAPLEANSKMLFCLLNNLIDDERFKMLMSYILPVKKILSTLAIYNDMGFLPSIGENTVDDLKVKDVAEKPGMYAVEVGDSFELKPGGGDGGPWAPAEDRWPGIFRGNGFFGWHFDKWDRRVLSKTKPRLKKLFKNYYNQREFTSDLDDDVGASASAALAEAFKFSPGERHFPWFKKKKLRSNPFDKNGNMCKK